MDPLGSEDPRSVGRYRLLGRLGGGGMGVVYLGSSPGGRLVAVKCVHRGLAADPEFRARFAQEVRAARRVGGFHTAQVVDADPDAEQPWLVTSYVPGVSLSDALAEYGPMPESALRVLGAGLAEALEAIHAAGLVHRDLKPSNVLLAADGPRVIDFGIARAAEAASITATNVIVGSPGFMAPEQISGGRPGPAADVFSLGCVLAKAAGCAPFGEGPVQALFYRVQHAEPSLDPIPPSLRSIVAACLAKDPAARPTPGWLVAHLGGADEVAGGQSWLPARLQILIAERAANLPGDAMSPTNSQVHAGHLGAGPTGPGPFHDPGPVAGHGRSTITPRRLALVLVTAGVAVSLVAWFTLSALTTRPNVNAGAGHSDPAATAAGASPAGPPADASVAGVPASPGVPNCEQVSAEGDSALSLTSPPSSPPSAGTPQPPSGLEPADQTVVTVGTPVTLRWSGNAGVAEVDIEYERGDWSHYGLFTGGSCIFTPTSVGYYLWDVGTGTSAFTPNPSMGSEQHYIVVDAAGQSGNALQGTPPPPADVSPPDLQPVTAGHPVTLTWSTTAAYSEVSIYSMATGWKLQGWQRGTSFTFTPPTSGFYIWTVFAAAGSADGQPSGGSAARYLLAAS